MNIAIVGYGRMGHIVEKLAVERGMKIKSIIDPNAEGATHKEINENSLKGVDVCIEFSSPESAVDNTRKIAALKKNLVLATTGWYGQLDEVKEIVKEEGIGFIYAPNFSIGVNVFFKIVENAAKIINNIESL